MNSTDQQLAQLLREDDAMSMPHAVVPLDAGWLLTTVANRRRRRMATRSLMVAALLVTSVASVRLWTGSPPQVAMPAAGETTMEDLSAAIAEIEVHSQQLVAELDQSFEPPQDVLAALQRTRNDSGPTAEELRAELAELESRAAATDTQLAWDRAWSRSGALRLELARHEAKVDPEQATAAYRQIAHSYAGTPWGDEAALVLTKVATP